MRVPHWMIGVLGGTFDPIHFGHLRPGLDVLQGLDLDQIRFIPLNVAVHRPQPLAPSDMRLAMLEAAIDAQPGFLADPRELQRPGGSYSVDTLMSLRTELGPNQSLCLLVGADAFAGFLAWHRPMDILQQAHLVVMRRPGQGPIEDPALRRLCEDHVCRELACLKFSPGGQIFFQDVTQVDISSTRVRQLIRRGLSPRYLLPDSVLALIEREGLYR